LESTVKQPFRIDTVPELESSTLVVGWSEDAARLGTNVIGYLNDKLGAREFGEIEPEDFFPLGGVSVEDDIAQFPESKFYYCPGKDLVIFKSSPPRSDWTVGAMLYLGAHTFPRELIALAGSPEMKTILNEYDLARDINYESPPGQRPTLNSYLLWVAQRRKLAAASLWVPVPFYLVGSEDPQAWLKIIEFLDMRLNLGMDLKDLNEESSRQDERMTRLRSLSHEVDNHIRKLENGLGLTQEESDALVREVEGFLREKD